MKERPILFSTDMVKAIVAGKKTQTRRLVKLPAEMDINEVQVHRLFPDTTRQADYMFKPPTAIAQRNCPYGHIGDRLYVRETYTTLAPEHQITTPYVYKANADAYTEEIRQEYIDRGYPYKWKPSIHMPKAAARIWLEVTGVSVERIQDISEKDALAEGVLWAPEIYSHEDIPSVVFARLWESIRCPDLWGQNPWVWVLIFRVFSTKGRPL